MVRRVLGVALAVAICALAGCGKDSGGQTQAASAAAPWIETIVVTAERGEASQNYSISSSLSVEHEADLLAEDEGRLTEVLADQGQRVRRGQLLAKLDDSRLRNQLNEHRAEMQRAEAQAKQTTVMIQAAEVELQRQSELFKEKLGSQRDYDRARFNLEAMRQEVEKVKHELQRARARVEADELSIARMELRSPFDGIVSRRYARTGEFLLADAKVLRVTELRPLLVRFTVPESLRQSAREGAVLDVAPADSVAPGVKARVMRTGYVVDAASGAVECVARIVEPVPDSLVPGMAVEVKIPGGGAAQAAAWIPRAAVHRTTGSAGEIFAVQGDKLRKRSVQLGRETESIVQVTGGLTPGEKIAAQFSDKLQDGMSVRVRP